MIVNFSGLDQRSIELVVDGEKFAEVNQLMYQLVVNIVPDGSDLLDVKINETKNLFICDLFDTGSAILIDRSVRLEPCSKCVRNMGSNKELWSIIYVIRVLLQLVHFVLIVYE